MVVIMNVLMFLFGVFIYIGGCYFFARLYFASVASVYQSTWGSTAKKCISGIFFLVFVVLEIPLGILLPAWLSSKSGFLVDSHGKEPTSILIIFGCLVLTATLWMAWRSKEGRRFARVTRL